MGCCGEERPIAGKVRDITVGFIRKMSNKKCADTDKRMQKCNACDKQTWMTKLEYTTWLARFGIDAVLANISMLERVTEELPKQEYTEGREAYCCVCKCNLDAKTRVARAFCPLPNRKWDISKEAKKE